jgi:hypothetical protein
MLTNRGKQSRKMLQWELESSKVEDGFPETRAFRPSTTARDFSSGSRKN